MLKKLKQLNNLTLKFLIVGFIGFVANYTVLTFATSFFNLNKIFSEVIAAALALQLTFLLHDRWTYRESADDDLSLRLPLKGRYILYLTSNAFSSVMTVILFSIFTQFIVLDFVALALSAAAAMVWNYVFNKMVIWKKKTQ